jgi:two-component system sensor kinase FixL
LIVVRAECLEERELVVMVSDSGPGIPTDKPALVFDPLVTTKASCMGIGLLVSRTIIEAHGSRIWAENNATKGSTFRFALPVAKEAD